MAQSKQALPDQEEAAAAHPAGTVVSPGQAAPAPQDAEQVEPVAQAEAEIEPEARADSDSGSALVSWTASEFVYHEKGAGWYTLLLVGAAVFAALTYLLTKDVISTIVVIVAAVILAIYAFRKPGEQQYSLDKNGINAGPKHYHYDDFKSFAVATDGAFSSLEFMPLRRFALPLTIYYEPADEEKIINLISERLPLEEHRPDGVDHLLRRIRF